MSAASDRIRPLTRWVAIVVVPFLWLAFLILTFLPDSTGERFAWAIRPHMTSFYIGAGYLGGSWLFLNTFFGKRWHRVQAGFPAITLFTVAMLMATFLHWDRFSHGTLGFNLWLILYAITPFLVPALWLHNRGEDTGQPEQDDQRVPGWVRFTMRAAGVLTLLFAVVGFILPQVAIDAWPWTLTPLTGRVMCGWISLLGFGSLVIGAEKRWSAWRVPLESILIWHILVLVAAARSASDFTAGLLNWYTVAALAVVGVCLFLILFMERRRLYSKAGASAVGS